MARAAVALEAAPEVDRLDGLDLPREQMRLIGHAREERLLLDAYRSGRIHHGWIFGGIKGSGKATLAFRFARFVLANPDPNAPAVQAATSLAVDPSLPVSRRVATGAHVDLLHLKRPWDEKAKRFKTEVPVDEVRRTVGFFGSTAGEGGWRIAIVDPADELNANAANALLKILEEPPARSLFLVIANHPGRLLPTIRSRCRTLTLAPLSVKDVHDGMIALGIGQGHADNILQSVATLSDGSLRRAALLLELGGVDIWNGVSRLMTGLPRVDLKAVHVLADQVSSRGADDVWELGIEFIVRAIHAHATSLAGGDLAASARWAKLHADLLAQVATAEALNLDRKALVLSIFRAIQATAKN
jgi:DNA polymerase-3 subunit delta'